MKFNILEKLKEIFRKSYNNKNSNSNTLENKTTIQVSNNFFEELKGIVTEELKKYSINNDKNISDFFDKTFDKEKVYGSLGRNTREDIEKSAIEVSLHLISKTSEESLEGTYNNFAKGYDLLKDKVLEDIPNVEKLKGLIANATEELKKYNINDDKYFIEYFNKTFDTEKIINFIDKKGMEDMNKTLIACFLHTDTKALDGSNEITFKDIIVKYPELVKDNLVEDVRNNKIKNLNDLDKDKNIKEIISDASKKAEDHNNKLEKKEGKVNEKEL